MVIVVGVVLHLYLLFVFLLKLHELILMEFDCIQVLFLLFLKENNLFFEFDSIFLPFIDGTVLRSMGVRLLQLRLEDNNLLLKIALLLFKLASLLRFFFQLGLDLVFGPI